MQYHLQSPANILTKATMLTFLTSLPSNSLTMLWEKDGQLHQVFW